MVDAQQRRAVAWSVVGPGAPVATRRIGHRSENGNERLIRSAHPPEVRPSGIGVRPHRGAFVGHRLTAVNELFPGEEDLRFVLSPPGSASSRSCYANTVQAICRTSNRRSLPYRLALGRLQPVVIAGQFFCVA